jgi:hypothetical protein
MMKISMQGMGVVGKEKCSKMPYKDGLCKKHYDKYVLKTTSWINRPGYVAATLEDITNGRSLKLRHSHIHKIYMQRKGVIKVYHSKTNCWMETDLPIDPNLFCVNG